MGCSELSQPSVLVSVHSSRKWIVWYVLSSICPLIFLNTSLYEFLKLTPSTVAEEKSEASGRAAGSLVREH